MFRRKTRLSPVNSKPIARTLTSPTAPQIQWERHCIFNSSQAKSVDYAGLLLFKDGSISSRERGFRRGEAIPDVTLGRFKLRRAEGSDVLRITTANQQFVWLEFELDIYNRWHEVVPLGTPAPTDEPPPLRQRSEPSVSLQRQFMSFMYGFAGDPPPNF